MENSYEIYWLKKGTVLAGKYRIDDVISEGGFGIVYRGFDLILKMDVAIKEYFPRRFAIREQNSSSIHIYKGKSGQSFEEGLQKFLNEARILAKFNDVDSIVTVRDFFYENNTAYIINEHVVGETVKKYVNRNGKMEPEMVLEIMKPILVSLGKIHETGLLHRDISPDNIILKDNRAVLIDFGAARSFSDQDDRSMTVFFKRGYSAQEQYVKKGKQNVRTDIYAVCATMYFMLTGIQPEESVQRTIKDTVVPLNKMRDVELNIWAKEAIMKGMSVSAGERYASVEALYRDLYGERRRWRRYPVKVAVALLLIVAGGGIFLVAGKPVFDRWIHLEHTAVDAEESAVSAKDSSGDSGNASEEIMQTTTPKATAKTTEEKIFQIPKVTGMLQSAAVKKLQKKSPEQIKIVVKKQYSADITSGRVIRQSQKAGLRYQAEDLQKITIWVSKGKKKQASDAQPKKTKEPVETKSAGEQQVSPNTAKNTKQDEEKENFAGALPW